MHQKKSYISEPTTIEASLIASDKNFLSVDSSGFKQHQRQNWVQRWQGVPYFSLEICGLATLTHSPGPFICRTQSLSLSLSLVLFSPVYHLHCPLTTVPFTVQTHNCRDMNRRAQGPAARHFLILHILILVILNKKSHNLQNTASVTYLCILESSFFISDDCLCVAEVFLWELTWKWENLYA